MRVKLPWWSLRQMFSNFILSFPSVTNGQSDKCKDCAAGQCATHCYVLLLRWGCDKDKGGNDHSEISLLKNQPSWLKLCLAASGNRLKDGYKYEKSKVKKVKRTIPAWASVTASKKVPVTNFAGTQNKVDNILIEAITVCANTLNESLGTQPLSRLFIYSLSVSFVVLQWQVWSFIPICHEIYREKIPRDGAWQEEVPHQEVHEETFGEGNHQAGEGAKKLSEVLCFSQGFVVLSLLACALTVSLT